MASDFSAAWFLCCLPSWKPTQKRNNTQCMYVHKCTHLDDGCGFKTDSLLVP
jgi:hypothetical protein